MSKTISQRSRFQINRKRKLAKRKRVEAMLAARLAQRESNPAPVSGKGAAPG